MSVRVVKVGGSLLRQPGLVAGLRLWRRQRPAVRDVLLCGGGKGADWIRELDVRFQLGPEESHWLCVRSLGITARVLSRLLTESVLLTSLADLREHLGTCQAVERPAVLDPTDFLQRDEPRLPGFALPACWDATSDSIAARLALACGAKELVLLKSRSADPLADLSDLASEGFVDPLFPQAAAELNVTWDTLSLDDKSVDRRFA